MIQAISEAPFPSFVAAASLALLITSCSDKTDVEEPSPTTVDASTTVVTSALSELLERSSFALSRPVVQHHLYPRRRPQPTQRSTTEDGLAHRLPDHQHRPLGQVPHRQPDLASDETHRPLSLVRTKLQRLHIGETLVTALSPLAGVQLTRLVFTPPLIEKAKRASMLPAPSPRCEKSATSSTTAARS